MPTVHAFTAFPFALFVHFVCCVCVFARFWLRNRLSKNQRGRQVHWSFTTGGGKGGRLAMARSLFLGTFRRKEEQELGTQPRQIFGEAADKRGKFKYFSQRGWSPRRRHSESEEVTGTQMTPVLPTPAHPSPTCLGQQKRTASLQQGSCTCQEGTQNPGVWNELSTVPCQALSCWAEGPNVTGDREPETGDFPLW